MPALLVAALLVSSFVLVHLWLRKRPMPQDYPLNVDEGLFLPELAQSSTVFSLTALFGAYLGIAIALGVVGVLGLAFGTVLGLFLVAYWISSRYWWRISHTKTFEGFLLKVLKGEETNVLIYAGLIFIVQCAYATSELLILRELSKAALGLKYQQATLIAILVAIIGYFYVLRGGYLAVFRTDLIQLGLVLLMALISGAVLLNNTSIGWAKNLSPKPGFWELRLAGSGKWLQVYHFVIAAIMGLSFMLASPDTWKRVFQVLKRETGPGLRVLSLAGAGLLPYVALLPLAIALSQYQPSSRVKPGFMASTSLSGNWVLTGAALGLIASFLSAFSSAIVAAAHVQLLMYRKKRRVPSEWLRFYGIMIAILFIIWLLFESAIRFTNPWLLGNFLMGAYAAIAGVQVGTLGNIRRLPRFSLPIIFVISMFFWVMYFGSNIAFLKTPTIYSVNTVPLGVGIFLGTAALCQLAIGFGGPEYVRRRRRIHIRNS